MMTDKLREAAQAALDWLRDGILDTWQYMDNQFYEDRQQQVKALEAALAEPEGKPMLDKQVSQLERELAEAQGEITRLKGEAESWEKVFDRTCELLAEAKEQLRLCNVDQFTTAAELAEATVKESLIAQRPWVGLTGDEIEDLNKDQTLWEIIRAAEKILKEKNT